MNKNSLRINEIIKDLYKVRNPSFKGSPDIKSLEELKSKVLKQAKTENSPISVSKRAFNDLVSSRNKSLVKAFEQQKLRKTVLACFGLSVGSNVVNSWMMLSRADAIKIADPDTIDATNLNRLPYSFNKIGMKKVDIVSELILGINPFVKISSYDKVDRKVYENLLNDDPKVDFIIDEIDDFESKVFLRKMAKKYKLPLLSAADVGDNIILDIERYDTNPEQEIFLGRLENVNKIDFKRLSLSERKKLIINLVGFEHNSPRMLESLLSIGGTTLTWPQLGPTAQIAGGAIALTIKNIILGEDIRSGRYYISLDNIFIKDNESSERVEKRKILIETIEAMMKE